MIYNQECKIPKYDWLDIMSYSIHFNEPLVDIKIYDIQRSIQNDIIDNAFDLTTLKYPNWPYRPNKRADKFYNKTIRKLCNYQYPLVSQIVINTDMLNNTTYEAHVDVKQNIVDQVCWLLEYNKQQNTTRKTITIPHQIQEDV